MPGQAPTSLVTSSISPISILIEWNGVPRKLMNGEPTGYVINTYLNDTVVQKNTTANFLDNFFLQDNLLPNTVYIFEVCALNNIGAGYCERTIGSTKKSRKIDSVPYIFLVRDFDQLIKSMILLQCDP